MVTTSIGIAAGLQATADDLVRDADIALYTVRAAGRNHHETFRQTSRAAIKT